MVEIVKGKKIAVEVISQDEAATLFGKLVNGRLFTAIVNNGSERKINCRKGVDQLDIETVSEIRANKTRFLIKK